MDHFAEEEVQPTSDPGVTRALSASTSAAPGAPERGKTPKNGLLFLQYQTGGRNGYLNINGEGC